MIMERTYNMKGKLPSFDEYGIVEEEPIPLDDNFVILKHLLRGAKIADVSFEKHDKVNNTHQDYLQFLLVMPSGDIQALTCWCTIPADREMNLDFGVAEVI